jgi:hypothetical protein
MGGPTSNIRYRQHSSWDHVTTQAPPLRQSRDTFGGVVTIHATKFNIINFRVFSTECIYVIRMILKILTNYIHTNTFNIIKSRIFPAECIFDSNYFKNNHQVFTKEILTDWPL